MNKFTLFSLTISSLLCIQSCTSKHGSASQKLLVAVIQYQHETCTFCPGGDTEIEDWTKNKPYLSGAEVLDSWGYIKGFVHSAKQYDDMELVGIKSPDRVYGGSSRSWNSKESFEHFMKIIIEDLESKMPVNGVYLALHGAMGVRDVPRPEAEIAKRIRKVVGDHVPIVASFDLHGNEDQEFLKWANASLVTKRYPHYDSFLQGGRSASLLFRMMKGDYVSTTATRHTYGNGFTMDRSITFHEYYGKSQEVGGTSTGHLRECILWFSLDRCSGYRYNGAGNHQ